ASAQWVGHAPSFRQERSEAPSRIPQVVAPSQEIAGRIEESESVECSFRRREELLERRQFAVAQPRVLQLPFGQFPRWVGQLDRASIGGRVHHGPPSPSLLNRKLAQRTGRQLWVYKHGFIPGSPPRSVKSCRASRPAMSDPIRRSPGCNPG